MVGLGFGWVGFGFWLGLDWVLCWVLVGFGLGFVWIWVGCWLGAGRVLVGFGILIALGALMGLGLGWKGSGFMV